MLSKVKAGVKEEGGRTAGLVPNWERRTHPFRKERGKGWGTRWLAEGVKGWASPRERASSRAGEDRLDAPAHG